MFWLPIEQYQKDGRIVRGLQRGAQSFTARTALAALEITTRIIHLLQVMGETHKKKHDDPEPARINFVFLFSDNGGNGIRHDFARTIDPSR